MTAAIVRLYQIKVVRTDARELTRIIRRHKPDAVVCGDPTMRYYGSMYMNHPDHRAASDIALDAAVVHFDVVGLDRDLAALA